MREILSKFISWGQFRFSIIGRLLSRPPAKGELCLEISKLASKNYVHPVTGEWVSFGKSTIERWYYRALNSEDPVKALEKRVRSDIGKDKAMSSMLLAELKKQYNRYPRWSYQLHADNLKALVEKKPELGDAPSYSTVLRRMKKHGWYKKSSGHRNKTAGQKLATERLEKREVRSYEAEYSHSLWHLDFHEGKRKILDSKGNWHKPVLLCILDDFSRVCCHIQWYFQETAEMLIHGLCQAFHKRGLPRSLMTDNGSAMIAHETQNGLLRLGIEHAKTLVYSPYQNGKQESFWGQVEGRLMAMLSNVPDLTLDFLNKATQAWTEMEYNKEIHEEIGTSPINRMLDGKSVSRQSSDSQALRFAFTVREKRTQRRSDGTISINGVRFEIPSLYRNFQKIHIRYQNWDLSQAFIVDERTDDMAAKIYPLDKTKNANRGRRSLEPIPEDFSVVEDDSNPIPPLLDKLMGEYAATGLPPAYLPKE